MPYSVQSTELVKVDSVQVASVGLAATSMSGRKEVDDSVAMGATSSVNVGAGPTLNIKYLMIRADNPCTITFADDAGLFAGTAIDMNAVAGDGDALILHGKVIQDVINALSTGTKLDVIRVVAGAGAAVAIKIIVGHDATP